MINEMKNSRSSDLLPMFYDCKYFFICLRYGWAIANVPRYCSCGKKNDIDHALSCKSGPYVNFRHNAIRDAYAEILKEVCVDVRTEPGPTCKPS